MLWLIFTIISYCAFGATSLFDRYLVRGPIPGAKIYAFYVGILGATSIVLFPFVGFFVPTLQELALNFSAGIITILALFALYWAFKNFEASKIIPAIGGILPIFTLVLIYFFSDEKISWGHWKILSFILLILGSILITYEKKNVKRLKGINFFINSFSLKGIEISIIIAFLFSLSLFLTKTVYISQPFWNGFIWIRIGGFLMALCFLFSHKVRNEIFKKRTSFKPKTIKAFFLNQSLAAIGSILQNFAIALAPLCYLAFINALQGIQYLFLLFLTIIISLKFPNFLKENVSKKSLLQKFGATFLIVLGLIIFTLS